jgi:hypothetical protein
MNMPQHSQRPRRDGSRANRRCSEDRPFATPCETVTVLTEVVPVTVRVTVYPPVSAEALVVAEDVPSLPPSRL